MGYNAIDIANWFIKKGISSKKYITQAKAQKLVYFAHGWWLEAFKEPLINETFEAWSYGPVIPELYHQLKKYGSQPITDPPKGIDDFDKNVEQLLEEIWETYGKLSTSRLIGLTHRIGDPWDQVYDENFMSITIDNEVISNAFARKR